MSFVLYFMYEKIKNIYTQEKKLKKVNDGCGLVKICSMGISANQNLNPRQDRLPLWNVALETKMNHGIKRAYNSTKEYMYYLESVLLSFKIIRLLRALILSGSYF